MISIELIRRNPVLVREAMSKRRENIDVDRILELDLQRRSTIAQADKLKAHRNEVSKQLGNMEKRPPESIREMKDTGLQIKTLEKKLKHVEEEITSLLLTVPNIPMDDVPLGKDESDNIVRHSVGKLPSFSFEPLPHWELGEKLDIIDFQRGAKLSGSRFFTLKGNGSKLQRSLISWMLDLHTQEHGYQEMYLPYLVNPKSATSSGHLPKFADTMYHDAEDGLWMIPTSEVPLTNLYRGDILPPGTLPLSYVSHSPCFRREKAAAGRDTRGIKRVHQFEKVEMYKFVEPKDSEAELESLLADAEEICIRLGIPHRVVQLCTGELGFASSKSYDVEMWAPGSGEWLEVSSCSNCTDFQARRASIKWRPEASARPQFVHTLNGSGLGIPRVIIAILENFQEADGSISIPEVLRPYTGFDKIG